MPTLTAADRALAGTLRMSVARLARRLRSQRVDTSLSLTQIAALATLDRHGPLTPRELAAHEKVQPPTMTRVLAALEERGFVLRMPHESDGRQVLLSVSDAGAGFLREDRRRRDHWLSQRLQELDPAELELLRRAAPVLDKLAGL